MIAAAILAAGASRRLGRPKQLLMIGGTTLVELVIDRVCASRCDRIGVVVGAYAAEVVVRVPRRGVEIVENVAWEEGMASSIRAATAWARSHDASGLLLCVVDQPRLSTRHLDALIDEFRRCSGTVASRYDGTLGVPAIFGSSSFAELAALTGDRGARRLLARPGTRALDWADGAVDIDLPTDHAAYAP